MAFLRATLDSFNHWCSLLLLGAVALVLASATTGYTSQLGAPLLTADDSAPPMVDVDDVRYAFNAAAPRQLEGVRFTLRGPQPPALSVSLDGDGAIWYPCRALGDGAWTCGTSADGAARLDHL